MPCATDAEPRAADFPTDDGRTMNLTQSGLYQLFFRQDKRAWARILFAAVAAGLMQGGIVVILNLAAGAIAVDPLNLRYLLMFLIVLAAYSLASHYATSQTVALTENGILATYIGIADKLRHMRLLEFERLGKARIYAILHTNTDIILETSKSLASVGAACVMILFCGIYIGYLSSLALIITVVCYSFGVFIYSTNFGNMQSLLRETDQHERRFKNLFGYFLEGFKEIRVNYHKSADLFDNYTRPAGQKSRDSRVRAEKRLTTNSIFVQPYYYVLVAAMIFLLPQLGGIEQESILQVAVVVLFSYGSATRIVQAIPLILKAEKAVGALHELEKELAAAREPCQTYSGRFAKLATEKRTIHLREACFDYGNNGQDGQFSLGPISLDVPPGELCFIVGGNGTGKTTLLKLLAGLYPAKSGALYLGEQRITDDNREDYRNLFSVLFSDYYLFDRFSGNPLRHEKRLDQALREMGLQERVTRLDGCFGELNLSSGQRKRLALICAHLEDRPILLLDEVAADLDPAFRGFFYESYLPRLKNAGKTIIAVSHDDKYYSVADRVIKLDAGHLSV
jgi:putative ATP-binding cassette transporter